MIADVDVIVVGGGAAGCVVARRLADAGRSVLLVEAGPDRRADPPPGFRDGWGLPQGFEWGYMSEPMPSGEPQRARRIKLLGGTGWLTRFAVRGSPADYDAWGDSWRFDDVLPYFNRLERDLDFGHEPWHGDSGPMPVTRYLDLEHTASAAAAFEALQASGFPPVEDHNRPGAVGAGRIPFSSLAGKRVTTADAYLPPDRMLSTLAIRADTHVDRVVFDGDSAIGVRLADGTVVHGGHVVLCAGAFGSAPILLRSGIGPADELRSLEIDVRADLPGVGANLADHAGVEIDVGYGKESRAERVLHVIASFHSSTLYSYPHVAGTCAIGSVVDTSGRVRGTERLSVIDASIMPDMVSGYTHFPTIMIAERLAEQIAR